MFVLGTEEVWQFETWIRLNSLAAKLKLRLDIKYFETCADLGLCPQFRKFKAPKSKVYENSTELFQTVLNQKPKEVRKYLAKIEKKYVGKKSALQLLKMVERGYLFSRSGDKFQKAANDTIITHKKKITQL